MLRKLSPMKRKGATILTVLVTALSLGVLVGCSMDAQRPASQEQENETRQSSYDQLISSQPAQTMQYSPTRATKNFWIETWDEPGKLSYVYLMNADGKVFGYYIFEGLPVSYCTSLIPPYQIIDVDLGEYNGNMAVAGPSVDGTFSSSSNCSTMYGKDATTGSYIEYTVGLGINALVYSEPMPLQDPDAVQALGWSKLEDVKQSER